MHKANTLFILNIDSMVKSQVNFSNRVYQKHDIKFIRMIGQGNWSDVYLAYNLSSTEKYAVKVIPQATLQQTPKLRQLVEAEKNILKNCKHQNIVTYIKDFNEDEYQFIVLEYCNGGDLGELLNQQTTISEIAAIKYMFQILNGFKGLHEVNAMHRDFKVQNVMLHDGCCKIVDLGFGKQLASLDSVTKTKLGSNLTMAPEVMKREPYGIKADIWSIGVVFYQLLEGAYPFTGSNMDKILQKIQKNKIVFSRGESSEVIDFIKRCLVVDPQKRIGWKQIYQHPLFEKLSSNKMINNSSLLADVKEKNKEYYTKNEEKDIKIGGVYKSLDNNEGHSLSQQSTLRMREMQDERKEVEEFESEIKVQNVQIRVKNIRPRIKQIDRQEQNSSLKQFSAESTQHQQDRQKQQQNAEQYNFSFAIHEPKQQTDNYDPAHYKFQRKHQVPEQVKEEPVQEQEFFKVRLTTTFHNYQQMLDNCCYVASILHDRYSSVKNDLRSINHDSYMAILWKDSYMKLAELIESLQSRRNIFHSEIIDLFFSKHREDYIKSFRGLLDQAKNQFNKMVKLARYSDIKNYHIFEAEAKNIEEQSRQNKKSWAKYVVELVNEYCLLLAQSMVAKKEYPEKLLIYSFCLAEFAKEYSNNSPLKYSRRHSEKPWSLSQRVSLIIRTRFDFNRARTNIRNHVLRAQFDRNRENHPHLKVQSPKRPLFKKVS